MKNLNKKNMMNALCALMFAYALLRYASDVAEGVRIGLQNCAGLLIPSLFPFMILAAVIGATRAGQGLSYGVSCLLYPLTGLPKQISAAFLMSFLGGFPVGAQMLSRQLENGEIDEQTASRGLCCCVNAGPSFLIGTIGAMLNPTAGILLLAAQVLSSLCIAAIQFRGYKNASTLPVFQPKQNVLVESVRGAASGMFGICAFVTAFSALSALLRSSGIFFLICNILGRFFPNLGEPFFTAAASGILEVTNGCIAAASLPQGFLLIAFLVSFSSLSIIFQVKSCFPYPIPFGRFYLSRLLHGLFTTSFAFLGQRIFPQALEVSAVWGKPVLSAQPNTVISTACLLAMCTILFFTPSKSGSHL